MGTKFAGNHAVSIAAVAKGIGRTYDLLTVTALSLMCGKESVRPEAGGGLVVYRRRARGVLGHVTWPVYPLQGGARPGYLG